MQLRLSILYLLVFSSQISAALSVRIFSREEALYENNISKPRIYIENTGNEPVSNFYYKYYFTVEDGKSPVIEHYYTPNESVTLEDLGNNEYAIKYNFTGVTLQPGQILPEQNGNAIGIRYTDWSVLSKNNDKSCTMSDVFALNGNISVYYSDGTLIYGNEIPDPDNPPVPPVVNNSLGFFAVYSRLFTDVRDRVVITGGRVGSALYTEIGCDAKVKGNVLSGANIFLRQRAKIDGDVIASEYINTQNTDTVTGIRRDHAIIQFPTISTKSIICGTEDITVNPRSSYTLIPGSYQDFHAYANDTITIQPGEYTFRKFILEPDVRLKLQADGENRINFSIQEDLRFADRTEVVFESDTIYPLSFNIYNAQFSQISIGTNNQIYGVIAAPNAEIHVYSGSTINGALYGRRVVLEPDVFVCKPPVLTGLWHSEWAIAPPFDPLLLQYTAVVPDVTTSLLVNPFTFTGHTVTVQDKSPENPVFLTSALTSIVMRLTAPEACGTTVYNLDVTRSASYRIFVNDDSPCASDRENGESWGTAFKSLQRGIDQAILTGKEIWVAEGKYKPDQRTNATDPRTATFQIYPGVEIRGGFNGTEYENKPQGSVYNTILTGDLTGNDDSISTWPPSNVDSRFLTDNAYHVVTMSGKTSSSSIRLERFTIQGGVANGSGENRIGAGIMNMNNMPTLEFVNVNKNIADSSGAGVYDAGGVKVFKNCLIKNNHSKKTGGAGLFSEEKVSIIDASIFDENSVSDTTAAHGGAAIYAKKSNLKMVNSIFVSNKSNSEGGGVFNDGGELNFVNCTFSSNIAVKNGQSIYNGSGSKSFIKNSILWSANANLQLSGTGFTVSYSCIRGGYTGTGNISSSPSFVNTTPCGNDGIYGSTDDGLRLTPESPCRDVASSDSAPDEDILTVGRPAGTGIDMGAYEYVELSKSNSIVFGTMKSGVFTEDSSLVIIDQMIHNKEVYQYTRSAVSRVMRAYVEKSKYTTGKSTIYGYVWPEDSNGSPLAEKVRIVLKQIGEENGLLVFQSRTPDYSWGKRLLFVGEMFWHNYDNPFSYTIYMTDNATLAYELPLDQF